MASKSKRRGRVFRASCLLAALIVAGSSFAWFTSSDEVTNRLSASSDYGVSIVESFTPPKNMLPGQEVNKDVYAVNTGNIAAFVKEDVSGVLNYTYETKVNTWDDKCVELTLAQVAAIQGNTTEDGFKTVEAGGFLAWTNAVDKAASVSYSVGDDSATVDSSIAPLSGVRDSSDSNNTTTEKTFSVKVTVGSEVYYAESADNNAPLYTVNTVPDPDQYTLVSGKTLKKTDNAAVAAPTVGPVYSGREQDITEPWTPSVEGVYIFRRSIGGDSAHPTFKYAGYYYKDGKYYKVVLGDDPYRAANENHTTTPAGYEFDVSANGSGLGDVTINEDGSFTGTPKISYVKDNEVKDKKVTFTYEDNAGGPRLVVNSSVDAPTTTENGVEYDADAYAARKEVDYNNKLGESNKATIEYNQAKAEYDYATALLNARNDLIDAAVARNNAYNALNADGTGAKAVFKTKWENLIQAAGGNTGAGGAIGTYNSTVKSPFVDNYTVDKLLDPTNVQDVITGSTNPVLTQAKQNLTNMKNLESTIEGLDTSLWNAIKQISTASATADEDHRLTPAQVDEIVTNINNYLDQLSTKVDDYRKAYSGIVSDTATATALGLGNDTATDSALTTLAGTTIPSLKTALTTAVSEYKSAYNDYQTAKKADEKAAETWAGKITAYNDAVNKSVTEGAKADFDAVVSQNTTGVIQPAASASYNPDAAKNIVPTYSANTTANGIEPKIDVDQAKTKDGDFTNDKGKPGFATIAGWDKNTPAAPDATDMNTKKGTMDTKVAETNTAKNAYDVAKDVLNASSNIKIYVNLDDAYNTYWQRDTNTDGTDDVVFYLRSILEAGETSGKLIDSIVLDKDTTARDYKNLTFDLNVGLDSAQINYANDQRTITTEATEGWALKPTLADNKSIDTAVTWATPVATP